MSHHGREPLSEDQAKMMERMFRDEIGEAIQEGKEIAAKEQALRAAIRDADKLGATGELPDGLITSSDEGEIKFAVARSGDRVVLDFGTAVAWIGFDGQQAIEIGRRLMKHGRKACKAAGQPAVITID